MLLRRSYKLTGALPANKKKPPVQVDPYMLKQLREEFEAENENAMQNTASHPAQMIQLNDYLARQQSEFVLS